MTRNVGVILLAIWLIITGAITLLGLSFQGLPVIMALFAMLSGILLIAGR